MPAAPASSSSSMAPPRTASARSLTSSSARLSSTLSTETSGPGLPPAGQVADGVARPRSASATPRGRRRRARPGRAIGVRSIEAVERAEQRGLPLPRIHAPLPLEQVHRDAPAVTLLADEPGRRHGRRRRSAPHRTRRDPVIARIARTVTPGVSWSTRNIESPRWRDSGVPVRARTTQRWRRWPATSRSCARS